MKIINKKLLLVLIVLLLAFTLTVTVSAKKAETVTRTNQTTTEPAEGGNDSENSSSDETNSEESDSEESSSDESGSDVNSSDESSSDISSDEEIGFGSGIQWGDGNSSESSDLESSSQTEESSSSQEPTTRPGGVVSDGVNDDEWGEGAGISVEKNQTTTSLTKISVGISDRESKEIVDYFTIFVIVAVVLVLIIAGCIAALVYVNRKNFMDPVEPGEMGIDEKEKQRKIKAKERSKTYRPRD